MRLGFSLSGGCVTVCYVGECLLSSTHLDVFGVVWGSWMSRLGGGCCRGFLFWLLFLCSLIVCVAFDTPWFVFVSFDQCTKKSPSFFRMQNRFQLDTFLVCRTCFVLLCWARCLKCNAPGPYQSSVEKMELFATISGS